VEFLQRLGRSLTIDATNWHDGVAKWIEILHFDFSRLIGTRVLIEIWRDSDK